MKNILILFGLLVLVGCSSNRLNPEEQKLADQKANDFLNNRTTSKSFTFFYKEVFDETYNRKNTILPLLKVSSMAKSSPERCLIEFDKFFETILTTQKGELSVQNKGDLQLGIFTAFASVVFPTKNEIYAAKYLNLIMDYSEPIQWDLLGQAYDLAEPKLSDKEKTKITSYMKKGINSMLKSNSLDISKPVYETLCLKGKEVLATM
jgi:hypothetical protein